MKNDWCEECFSEEAKVTWHDPQTNEDLRLCHGCYSDLK